ncbi:hypothetical protein FIBSPDRAFT_875072 [Athelia psychrophila]|uniref:Uncharacterized protein n=1 Tax=Athelia psychrophila TaxID=1759441 RepID=A0A165WQP4_9AGAM|nr:hypothetical protein FIBSPDRAFT_875070 [Fibularhizoctonia sp. CBS 109695]KZP07815.1 hypothetical protein FIBSPDRAFT_875072 [Fibularhizoctonia sp. CBS 109695]
MSGPKHPTALDINFSPIHALHPVVASRGTCVPHEICCSSYALRLTRSVCGEQVLNLSGTVIRGASGP